MNSEAESTFSSIGRRSGKQGGPGRGWGAATPDGRHSSDLNNGDDFRLKKIVKHILNLCSVPGVYLKGLCAGGEVRSGIPDCPPDGSASILRIPWT